MHTITLPIIALDSTNWSTYVTGDLYSHHQDEADDIGIVRLAYDSVGGRLYVLQSFGSQWFAVASDANHYLIHNSSADYASVTTGAFATVNTEIAGQNKVIVYDFAAGAIASGSEAGSYLMTYAREVIDAGTGNATEIYFQFTPVHYGETTDQSGSTTYTYSHILPVDSGATYHVDILHPTGTLNDPTVFAELFAGVKTNQEPLGTVYQSGSEGTGTKVLYLGIVGVPNGSYYGDWLNDSGELQTIGVRTDQIGWMETSVYFLGADGSLGQRFMVQNATYPEDSERRLFVEEGAPIGSYMGWSADFSVNIGEIAAADTTVTARLIVTDGSVTKSLHAIGTVVAGDYDAYMRYTGGDYPPYGVNDIQVEVRIGDNPPVYYGLTSTDPNNTPDVKYDDVWVFDGIPPSASDFVGFPLPDPYVSRVTDGGVVTISALQEGQDLYAQLEVQGVTYTYEQKNLTGLTDGSLSINLTNFVNSSGQNYTAPSGTTVTANLRVLADNDGDGWVDEGDGFFGHTLEYYGGLISYDWPTHSAQPPAAWIDPSTLPPPTLDVDGDSDRFVLSNLGGTTEGDNLVVEATNGTDTYRYSAPTGSDSQLVPFTSMTKVGVTPAEFFSGATASVGDQWLIEAWIDKAGGTSYVHDAGELYLSTKIQVDVVDGYSDIMGATISVATEVVLDDFDPQTSTLSISGAQSGGLVTVFAQKDGWNWWQSHNADASGDLNAVLSGFENVSGPGTLQVALFVDANNNNALDDFDSFKSYTLTLANDGTVSTAPGAWTPPQLLPQEIEILGDVAPGSVIQVNVINGMTEPTITLRLTDGSTLVPSPLIATPIEWNKYKVELPPDSQGLTLVVEATGISPVNAPVDNVPFAQTVLEPDVGVVTNVSFDNAAGDHLEIVGPVDIDAWASRNGQVTLEGLYLPDLEPAEGTVAQFRIDGVLNNLGQIDSLFVDADYVASATVDGYGVGGGWVLADPSITLSVPLNLSGYASEITYQLLVDGVAEGEALVQEVFFDHYNPQWHGGGGYERVPSLELVDRDIAYWGPSAYGSEPPSVLDNHLDYEYVVDFSEAVYFTNVWVRQEAYYSLVPDTDQLANDLELGAGNYIFVDQGNAWKVFDVTVDGSETLAAYLLKEDASNGTAIASIETLLAGPGDGSVQTYLYGAAAFESGVDIDQMWVQKATYYDQVNKYWLGQWTQINRFMTPEEVGRFSSIYVASDTEDDLQVKRPVFIEEVVEEAYEAGSGTWVASTWADGATVAEQTISYHITGYSGPTVRRLDGLTQNLEFGPAKLAGLSGTLEWSSVNHNDLTGAFDAVLTLTVSSDTALTPTQIEDLQALITTDAIAQSVREFTGAGIRDTAGNLLDGFQYDVVAIEPGDPTNVIYQGTTGDGGRDTLDLTALGGGLSVQPEYGFVIDGNVVYDIEFFPYYKLAGSDNEFWGLEDRGFAITFSGEGGNNEVVGSAGQINTVSYADAAYDSDTGEGIFVDLSDSVDGWVDVDRLGGTDRVRNIDNFIGSAGDDTMFGSAGFDWLVGGDGDDIIVGGPLDGSEATRGDILIGGTGVLDQVVGSTGVADIIIDLDGGTLSGRADTEAWVSGEKSAESDHDVFVVGATGATIKNFALSSDQAHLSGRSGAAADRIVFALQTAALISAAMAENNTPVDPAAADFALTDEIIGTTKAFVASLKIGTVASSENPDDLILRLYTGPDDTPADQVEYASVTLTGVNAALSGDKAEVIRLDKFEASAFDLASFAGKYVVGGQHDFGGDNQDLGTYLAEQFMARALDGSDDILIPVAIEAVKAGTIGQSFAGAVLAPAAGILDTTDREFVPGYGDQDMIGGRGGDTYSFVVQNFTEESRGIAGDAGRDTVFDAGGSDTVYLGNAKIADIEVYAVHVGRERSANSLEIKWTQTTQDGQNPDGSPNYLTNSGSIDWLGHYREGARHALETITVQNEAGDDQVVYTVSQAQYGTGGRDLVVDAGGQYTHGIVAGEEGGVDHIVVSGAQNNGPTELRVWGFDTATDTIDISNWLVDNSLVDDPLVWSDKNDSDDSVTIFKTVTGAADIELSKIYFMDWASSESVEDVTFIYS